MLQRVTMKIGESDLVLETGRMAKQANGAVLVKFADTAVLSTVCCSESDMEGIDYLPLSVEYNEKYYAAGKIPGGFIKREGRPKDREILVSRLIDRPMRPLFPKNFRRDIQIVPTTISADQINPPDIVAMIASSAAVSISDIPFEGPIGAVRVAYVDDQFIVNPTYDQIEKSKLDIVVAGTATAITMVEGGSKECSEEVLVKSIQKAHEVIKEIVNKINELVQLSGLQKIQIHTEEKVLSIRDEIWQWAFPKMESACFVKGKKVRSKAIKSVKEEAEDFFADRLEEEQLPFLSELFGEMESQILRQSIVEKGIRHDGRAPDEIREITCEIDVLPRTHGSGLFTRGETQALAVTTLGTVMDELRTDDIAGEDRKAFMLHYNFPPYSVGETGRLSTGRREVGHGHLAERALEAVLPTKEDFPYTIRIVSEILESNGSSSMATVSGGALSLMNAGVPIRKAVTGIAMGLVKEGDKFVVLSDISGEEDHLGDMDFKVAGTDTGITAFQMDIKIEGVTEEILTRALEQARQGRLKILDIMNETIEKPRSSLSDYAPKIITLRIDPSKIGAVIGSGGSTIRGIQEETDASVNIDDEGIVSIYSKNKNGAEKAQQMIESLVEEPVIGKIYNGTVKKITDFGAFIEFLPGKEGLCHISKIAKQHIRAVSDVLSRGQEVKTKVIDIDRFGKVLLSCADVDSEGIDKSAHSSHRRPPYRQNRDRPSSGPRRNTRNNRN